MLTFHPCRLSALRNQAILMVLITTLRSIDSEDVQGIPMANYLRVEAKWPKHIQITYINNTQNIKW